MVKEALRKDRSHAYSFTEGLPALYCTRGPAANSSEERSGPPAGRLPGTGCKKSTEARAEAQSLRLRASGDRAASADQLCRDGSGLSCISARDIGAPHERERVFLVAYPDQEHGQERVGHFENGAPPIFAGDDPERDAFWLQATREAVGMADGLPARLYKPRVEGIGNAIVPQIAQWIAERIKDAHFQATEQA